jgi:hypothetical protein
MVAIAVAGGLAGGAFWAKANEVAASRAAVAMMRQFMGCSLKERAVIENKLVGQNLCR